jgi:hypothetical protein
VADEPVTPDRTLFGQGGFATQSALDDSGIFALMSAVLPDQSGVGEALLRRPTF